MLTRKMAEEMQRLIENLTAQLEEQRLQITALEKASRSPTVEVRALPEPSTLPVARTSFDKIPDAIKMIVSYSGDPKVLACWLESTEDKINFAKMSCTSEEEVDRVMPLWMSIIRDKIVDKANEALVSSHTPCNWWSAIKNTLTEYFGDKRDLCTLVTKISYLQQGNRNIIDFYGECRELLSDITAKIMLDKEMQICAKTLTTSYEYMVTNAFIDGLNEPYATLTRTSRPSSLLVAYQNALDQFNAAQRRKEKFRSTNSFQKPFMKSNTPANHWLNNRPPFKPTQTAQNTPSGNTFSHASSQNPSFNNRPYFSQNSAPNNRPQPLLSIKADPSGQRNQGNSFGKQQRAHNVNSHEESNTDPEAYEESSEFNENTDVSENAEELNFHFAFDHRTEN